ncbi:MAG: DUF167 domain-containing protein [Nitrosopumilus sp.]
MGFRATSIIKFNQNNFPKDLIYKVKVEFSREFLEIQNDQINIGIRSKPIKGEANKEIIKKIAKHFKISTSLIQIKSGHKASEKIIEVLK